MKARVGLLQTQLEPRDVQKELRAQYLTLKREVHHAKRHLKIEERKLKEEEKEGEDLQQEIKEASEAVELVRTQTEKVSQVRTNYTNSNYMFRPLSLRPLGFR